MASNQLEQAYIELGRLIQVNRMCQGKFGMDWIRVAILYADHPPAAAMTWLVYDSCKPISTLKLEYSLLMAVEVCYLIKRYGPHSQPKSATK